MYQNILVALDTSHLNQDVFAEALAIAQNHGSTLHLCHVLSAEEENSPLPIPPDLGQMYTGPGNDLTLKTWQEQWENFEKEGLALLHRFQETAAKAGVTTTTKQISGSPGRILCKQAHQGNFDLIVIGRRGRRGLSELILGSVSNYVLHHAPCSVLVVQHPPRP